MKRRFLTVILVSLCVLLTGCATTPEGKQQQLGTAIGIGIGALTGGLIGHSWQGALIGAVAGGILGWTAVSMAQYHSDQVRSAKQDSRVYGLTKAKDSPTIVIREARLEPEQAKPGDVIVITTDYSLALPKKLKETQVTETWTLKKDGKVLQEFEPQTSLKDAGGYSAGGSIPLPSKVGKGTYVLEHKVEAGTSYDTAQSIFYISS